MLTDIARHLGIHDADVNWLEGAQLMLSALVVPAFAKLGDMVGHKRMLLISTALTAAAALVLPFTDSFSVFLIAWALMGFYVVWLPLEIALIWSRSRRMEGRAVITARAAGFLVAALETGAIVGALVGGALIDTLPLTAVLLVPAVLIVVCFFVILFGVKESPEPTGGVFDTVGLILISLALICFTGGLSLLRLEGGLVEPAGRGRSVALGILLVCPVRRSGSCATTTRSSTCACSAHPRSARCSSPRACSASACSARRLRCRPSPAPTRTNTATASARRGFATSLIIGIYLIAMIVGALLFPLIARLTAPRLTLMGASTLVGIGFLLFLPFHDTYVQVIVNMVIVGLGSGALVAALPAAAASAAPADPDGRRDRPDQLGEDRRRGDRVVRVRHRAAERRDRRASTRGDGRLAERLLHGVDRLRRDRARRRGGPGVRAEDRVHRPRSGRGGYRAGGALKRSERRCSYAGQERVFGDEDAGDRVARQRRAGRRARPHARAEHLQERLRAGCGVEVEVDRHVARIVDGPPDRVGANACCEPHRSEPGERRPPRVEVGDRMLDVQCVHGAQAARLRRAAPIPDSWDFCAGMTRTLVA